ncbi:hypothetical protein DOJK_00978 [Patescibacteria group bacterium]|nr:hypothetical protein DOJK_00978 [Patescibacteria group bacterium]
MSERSIEVVLDIQKGNLINAEKFFALPEDKVFKGRRKLEEYNQRNEPLLVCSCCYQPVKIRGREQGFISIHFAHFVDSGDCPYKSYNKYTKDEIERMKYNGVKESPLHKKLKYFITDSIKLDNRFSNVKTDEVYKGTGLLKEWKKPDVSGKFNNTDIVFEIQLSTTFLSVIVKREEYYKKNNTFIMWFFNQFSTDEDSQRFTEKDIIYSNNNNAFIINNETISITNANNKFIFGCYYIEPYLENNCVKRKWQYKTVSIDELKWDYENYKVYYYDSEGETKKLKNKLEYSFIEEFKTLIINEDNFEWKERYRLYQLYEHKFAQKGILFEASSTALKKIIQAILCLKLNDKIGYENDNVLGLSNTILEYRKEYYGIYIKALKCYNKYNDVLQRDEKKGIFKKKLSKLQSEKVEQETRYNKLFQILFPELII